jgi:hypothetical protein
MKQTLINKFMTNNKQKKVNVELVESAGTISQFSSGVLEIHAIQILHTIQKLQIMMLLSLALANPKGH